GGPRDRHRPGHRARSGALARRRSALRGRDGRGGPTPRRVLRLDPGRRGDRMKVLLAEDDLNIREALRAILESEGYQAIVASDGHEALARYEAEKPHFILLDIMMPGLNGYDVCRRIRAGSAVVPVIF